MQTWHQMFDTRLLAGRARVDTTLKSISILTADVYDAGWGAWLAPVLSLSVTSDCGAAEGTSSSQQVTYVLLHELVSSPDRPSELEATPLCISWVIWMLFGYLLMEKSQL